jgi:hypothetical protein
MSTKTKNHGNIDELRTRIMSVVPSLALSNLDHSKNYDDWWLLGTMGCHLCDDAEQMMTRFQSVQPITYQHIDISDFDEELMMAFATTIPVLLTPSKRLNYPFSVMDLQQLFISETPN